MVGGRVADACVECLYCSSDLNIADKPKRPFYFLAISDILELWSSKTSTKDFRRRAHDDDATINDDTCRTTKARC